MDLDIEHGKVYDYYGAIVANGRNSYNQYAHVKLGRGRDWSICFVSLTVSNKFVLAPTNPDRLSSAVRDRLGLTPIAEVLVEMSTSIEDAAKCHNEQCHGHPCNCVEFHGLIRLTCIRSHKELLVADITTPHIERFGSCGFSHYQSTNKLTLGNNPPVDFRVH